MTSPLDDREKKRPREACFRRNPVILERQIDDTVFLVNPDDETIFYLNPLSAGLWRLLAETVSIAVAGSIVQDAFPDTPPDQIVEDVSKLIEDMERRRLILRVD